MNGFDALILALAAALALLGAWKGFVRLGLGAAGLVTGLMLGVRWEGPASRVVGRVVRDELWARLVAFIGIVVAIAVTAALVSWTLRRMLHTARLLWADRLLGSAAGILCAVLLAGCLALILSTTLPQQSTVLSESRLAPYALIVSRGLARLAPQEIRDRFQREVRRLAPRS